MSSQQHLYFRMQWPPFQQPHFGGFCLTWRGLFILKAFKSLDRFYYVAMIVLSYLGTFGGTKVIPTPWDQAVVIVISLITYYWGAATGLSKPMIDDDDVED